MVKIIGKDALNSFSQDIVIAASVKAQDLPILLHMPDELADIMIMVRDHQKLENDEFIHDGDEIYLFMAVMGG